MLVSSARAKQHLPSISVLRNTDVSRYNEKSGPPRCANEPLTSCMVLSTPPTETACCASRDGACPLPRISSGSSENGNCGRFVAAGASGAGLWMRIPAALTTISAIASSTTTTAMTMTARSTPVRFFMPLILPVSRCRRRSGAGTHPDRGYGRSPPRRRVSPRVRTPQCAPATSPSRFSLPAARPDPS